MRAASVALLVIVGACGGTDNPPSLAISPSGSGNAPLAVSSATSFKATLLNSDEPVTWTLTGSGSISTTTGLDTVFVPPLGSNTETLTATAGDLTASVQIASGPMVLTAETIPTLGAPVTVQYDPQQIPHIQCAEAADCLAVQGYLQIRDRTFPMDFLRRVATSRVAEMIGVDGLSQDEQLRALFITRNGHKVQDDLAAAMDPTTKTLLDAYVSGINAYIMQLRTTQGDTPLPNEYRQLPYPLTANDIPLWTEQDTWAVARFEQFSLSDTSGEEAGYGKAFAAWGPGATTPQIDKVVAWIRSASPPSEQAHTLAETPFTPAFAAGPVHAPATATAKLGAWSGVIAKAYDAAQRLAAFIRPLGAAVGSNNWAVMGSKSKTGKAMVANDPHLPLQYPPLFWLSTMTSADPADNLDLSGGSFPGIPGALVGRGKNVGWGVTVTGYDVTDLYLEALVPCGGVASSSGLCTSFNGGAAPIIAVPETYNVRVAAGSGSGALETFTYTGPGSKLPDGNPPLVLVAVNHGPITSLDLGNGAAVSLRWTGQEGNTQDLKAVWGLNTATDVDSAMTALAGFSTGAQNWMLADDQGNIAYDPHALVPVRLWASTSNSAFVPWLPVPGDGTAEWGDGVSDCANGSGVPASCWVPDADLPHGKNPTKGYYFTANADPTADGVSDSGDPRPAVTGSGSDPYYLSFDWDDSTGFRATRIDQMLQAAIAANGTVSLDDMAAIQSDHYMRYGSAFVAYLAANIGSGDLAADSTLALAYNTLVTQWPTVGFDCPSGLLGDDQNNSPVDTTPAVQQASGACFLFHTFVRHLLTNVFADDIGPLGFSIDGNMVQAVKAMLFMLSGDAPGTTFCDDRGGQTHTCKAQVITALDEAVEQISASYGADPTAWTWGRVHFIQPTPLVALVTTGFEPGPYARPGGAFTVDVGTPSGETSYGLTFQYNSGGNVRHISVMDPTAPVTKMQLPGPERDGPTGLLVSGGPADLLSQWVMNQYFDFAIGTQITGVATSTQTFSAQ